MVDRTMNQSCAIFKLRFIGAIRRSGVFVIVHSVYGKA